MRLYRGKVPVISEELTQSLIDGGDIEVLSDMVAEVVLDIESVLNEYRRVDRDILEKAKDLIASRKLDYSNLHRIRQTLAEQRGFGLNENAYGWIIDQLIEMLLHSKNVEEVFAEDNALRKKMRDVLKKHTEMDRDLDRQVRARIKNLQEDTQDWDVEYQKVMGDLRRTKNLD
jgi:hypothetical protein